MAMLGRAILVLVCGAALSGCAVHELHKDQDLIRSTLLDLYTNQVMDNLVRAANGMPIIQLDYNQAQANVTIKNTVGGSESQAVTASNVFALPAASLMATRTIMTTLMGNLSNENTNQVAVSASPVITSNEVYDAYLEYLTLPGSLMVSCDPPPPGMSHLCKKYDGKYFWIPLSHRSDFFRLALLTTAQRGKALLPPDAFYSVTVRNIEEEREGQKGVQEKDGKIIDIPAKTKYIVVLLDKEIPNDSGTLVFDTDTSKADTDKPNTDKPNTVKPDTEKNRYSIIKYVKQQQFKFTDESSSTLKAKGVPDTTLEVLKHNLSGKVFETRSELLLALCRVFGPGMPEDFENAVLDSAKKDEMPPSSNTSRVTILINKDLDQDGAPLPAPLPDGMEATFKGQVGKTAKIYLEHTQPTAPSTNDLLNKVNFNLQQIQFNQLRTITDP